MPKTDSINALLTKELAEAVNREIGIPGALVTVSFVKCDSEFNSAKVYFSVLPDNMAGTVLHKLNAASGQIANLTKKRVKLRKFPRLSWQFDPTEKEATQLEQLIDSLDDIK
jgi:ribosome-binding factor A